MKKYSVHCGNVIIHFTKITEALDYSNKNKPSIVYSHDVIYETKMEEKKK